MAWTSVFKKRFKWNFLGVSTFGLLRTAIGFGPSQYDRQSNDLIIESDGEEFTSVSLKGKSSRYRWKEHNQDSYFYHIKNNLRLLGVCDGHGSKGHDVSSHIVEQISNYVTFTDDINTNDVESRLNSMVSHTIDTMKEKGDIDSKYSGSTLIFSYIDDERNRLYTANIGDSRAIICYKEPAMDYILQTKQLNVEHSPKVKSELNRIYENGGFVDARGYVSHGGSQYGINMTRSLGDDDIHYNNIVSSDADIMRYDITNKDLVVIHATDGIWDVMDNAEVAGIVNNYLPDLKSAAIDIVKEAKRRWLMYSGRVDDITIVIYALKPKQQLQ